MLDRTDVVTLARSTEQQCRELLAVDCDIDVVLMQLLCMKLVWVLFLPLFPLPSFHGRCRHHSSLRRDEHPLSRRGCVLLAGRCTAHKFDTSCGITRRLHGRRHVQSNMSPDRSTVLPPRPLPTHLGPEHNDHRPARPDDEKTSEMHPPGQAAQIGSCHHRMRSGPASVTMSLRIDIAPLRKGRNS